jgi:hypothetical protein
MRRTDALRATQRLLVIALLVWVQVLGPFVHAHAGTARIGGWHVHTAVPLAAATLQADAPSPEAWRQEPESSDGPEVGVSAGLPQARDVAVSEAPSAADDGPLALLAFCLSLFPAGNSTRSHAVIPLASPPLDASREGLPALPHAPPLS